MQMPAVSVTLADRVSGAAADSSRPHAAGKDEEGDAPELVLAGLHRLVQLVHAIHVVLVRNLADLGRCYEGAARGRQPARGGERWGMGRRTHIAAGRRSSCERWGRSARAERGEREREDARVHADVLQQDAESPREVLRVEEEEGPRVSSCSAAKGTERRLGRTCAVNHSAVLALSRAWPLRSLPTASQSSEPFSNTAWARRTRSCVVVWYRRADSSGDMGRAGVVASAMVGRSEEAGRRKARR